MDYSLSDAELVLLLLIAEHPGINGYGIGQVVEQRGLSAWAGVASSSIYNGLKKIEQRGLATSAPDTTKAKRGPRGRVFHLTNAGRGSIEEAVVDGLATTREHDPRCNIALSGIDQLDPAAAIDALERRGRFLAAELDRLRTTRGGADGLPLGAELLFDRILHAIESERAWTAAAMSRVESVTRPRAGGPGA